MTVMEDTAIVLEDKMSDEKDDQRIDSRAQRISHEDEFTNSSFSIEAIASESSPISISVPEGQALAKDIPIELNQLIRDASGFIQTIKRELRVSLDHKSGNIIVSVVDGDNCNVIRQISQNNALAVESLITAPAGMLFHAFA